MAKKKYLTYNLYGLLILLILTVIALCSVPPVSRDALTHHLAVPKLYIQHGGMYEIPSMKFSYYPMNLELLYMIPMYFGNDILPKLIHFAFALATAWLIFLYLKNRLNILYAVFGALLFLSTPIVVKLSITAYVDLGLVFFSTASLILLLRWVEKDYKLRYLICSGVCCGLALGTKYNGLVVLFLLTLFTPIMYIRGKNKLHEIKNRSLLKQSKAMGYGLVFFVTALIIFSPWIIRNYFWKENPIYPLYHNIIKSEANIDFEEKQKTNVISRVKNHLTHDQKRPWNHFLIRRFIYKESWCQIALIPLRIFYQGQDGNPKYFDGKLNPLLLLLPLFAFIRRNRECPYLGRERNWFLGFSVFLLIYTFIAQSMRTRYIAPIIPALVILSVIGVFRLKKVIQEECTDKTKRFYTCFAIVSLILFMLINVNYFINQFKYVKPFDYICSELSRDEYITKFRPEYPVIMYANKNLPKNSIILGIFMGNRRYYSDKEMIFNDRLLSQTNGTAKSSKILFDTLKKKSITHILIWESYLIQWMRLNYSNKDLIDLHKFFNNYTTKIYSSRGYTLYQLRN